MTGPSGMMTRKESTPTESMEHWLQWIGAQCGNAKAGPAMSCAVDGRNRSGLEGCGEDEWSQSKLPSTSPVRALPMLRDLRDPAAAAVRWRRWKARLENHFVAMRITDSDVKAVYLVEMAGGELEDLLSELSGAEGHENYEAVVTALDRYFNPLANPDRELVNLRRAVQGNNESIDGFHDTLKKMVCGCIGLDRVFETKM